jgi:hypothetical protein
MPSLIVFRSSVNTIIYPYTYPIRATDNYPPRRHFTEESTGPFSIVSEKNTCYKKYIEMDIEKRFKREDQDYIGYTAPALHVIGCRLSPGLKIPICGRYPDL